MPVSFFVYTDNSLDRERRVHFFTVVPEANPIEFLSFSWIEAMLYRCNHMSEITMQALHGCKNRTEFSEDGQKVEAYYRTIPKDSLYLFFAPFEAQADFERAEKGSSENTLKMLIEINRLAQEHGAELILYTPPYHHSYLQAYPNSYMKELMCSMHAFTKKNGIRFYDCHNSPYISNSASMYLSSSHLNKWGAVAFSQKIKRNISKN